MKRLMILVGTSVAAATLAPGSDQEGTGAEGVAAATAPDREHLAQHRRASGGATDAGRGSGLADTGPGRQARGWARQLQADAKKFVDEATPLLRERAIKLAPSTFGVMLEEKFSEAELKQLIAWLESPVNKKFQQLGPEMQGDFVQKLAAEAAPLLDPKLQALQQKMRASFDAAVGTAPASGATAALLPRPSRPRRQPRRASKPASARSARHGPYAAPDRADAAGAARADRRRRRRTAGIAQSARRTRADRGRREEEGRLGGVPARARGAGHRRR